MYLQEFSVADGEWMTVAVEGDTAKMRRIWDARWKAGADGLRLMETVVKVEKIRPKKSSQ